jgi:predicted acetyltransferase
MTVWSHNRPPGRFRDGATTLGEVTVDVRTIVPEELVGWVECLYTAFHGNAPAAEVAAYRTEVLGQDYSRTLAAVEQSHIVGTYESFPAELTLPGGTCLPTNAISSVSVLPTHHRRGLLRRMIDLDLRNAIERGEAASILLTSEYPIYGRFGFGPATERAEYTFHPAQARFLGATPGKINLVKPADLREIAPALFDRFRVTRPGQIDRHPRTWDRRLGLRPTSWGPKERTVRCATYTTLGGEAEGYLCYRSGEESADQRGVVELTELIAISSDAYLGLWRYCAELDLVGEIKAAMRCVDEPLPWLLDNPRVALQMTRQTDYLWVRPMDVPRLLGTRRYAASDRLVLEVRDPLELSGGRFRLEGGPEGATCQATEQSADVQLGMTALGAISLGGVHPHVLSEAGLVEELRPGALAAAERLFPWPITPWCSTFF